MELGRRAKAVNADCRGRVTVNEGAGDGRMVRVSDTEREAVAARLSEACAAGRLTAEELDRRAEAAYRARTYADLDELTSDLPGELEPSSGPHGGEEVGLEPWPPQWLRGVLDIAVLAAIAEGPTYGYQISTRLQRAGLGRVKGGTLYPLLGRLVDTGAVTTQWHDGVSGPGRKYFYLTTNGAAHLDAQRRRWRQFTARTHALLEGTDDGTENTPREART